MLPPKVIQSDMSKKWNTVEAMSGKLPGRSIAVERSAIREVKGQLAVSEVTYYSCSIIFLTTSRSQRQSRCSTT